ncbi:MAG TPA: glycoside hydrolase family 15 protein [Acidimicrobiia bacterium]
MSKTPIADLALLSDCHSAALVDKTGSVVWWCAPRFDSPSVFAGILDDDAGHFTIRPAGIREVARSYRTETLVLETHAVCEDGEAILTDALAMREGVRGHDLGRESPHMLLRHARCVRGEVDIEIEFVPRTEYGLSTPIVSRVDGGLVAESGPVTLVLHSDVDLEISETRDRAWGTAKLRPGDDISFAAKYMSSWRSAPLPVDAGSVPEAIDDTTEAWQSWSAEHQRYEGPFADQVHLAGRVLQGLTYVPTGAIVAAPTTSLPETVGGGRNWDYRFAWVRDASFTLDALWVAACPDEEQHFFGFLTTAASSVYHRDQLQVMFGIQGERILNEYELPWLSGWHDSQPVRVGNAAWSQRQNDVYGELLTAAHRLRDWIDFDRADIRRMLIATTELAASVWNEPDQGIWEMRDEPRHYLHSKLMCWAALDRAIDMADVLQAGDQVDRWKTMREEISRAILERAWDDDVGAFTQSFESSNLDASALVIPIVGFLPSDDPRILSTIRAIETELMDESGLVARYEGPDGLDGEEGAFLLCTFWLAHAHALAGNVARAREVLANAAGFANDLGLFAEEVDAGTGALLGNFPQALSHIGLVNAAWAIVEAERSRG